MQLFVACLAVGGNTPNNYYITFLSLSSRHPDVEEDTACCSQGEHDGQPRTGNRKGSVGGLMLWGIRHKTKILCCGKRRVDVAAMTPPHVAPAESPRRRWIHLQHQYVVTQFSTISEQQILRSHGVEFSECRSNRLFDGGTYPPLIGGRSRVC